MLSLLHSLELYWQKQRPVHQEEDSGAQEHSKRLSGLMQGVAARRQEAERIELWLEDEEE